MQLTPNGMKFDDVYELNYEILNELELEVKPNGQIWDAMNNSFIAFNGANVIASIRPDVVHYPGQGEIEFDIINNVRMATTLFGAYLAKKMKAGMPFVSYFSEERTEPIDDGEIKYTNLTVKYDNYNSIESDYFHNKCLKFIDLIFKMEDNPADLRNFDTLEDVQ